MSKKTSLFLILLLVVSAASIYTILTTMASSPFSNPWEKAIPYQKVPEGLTTLASKECGSCHTDHYEEWQTSTHAMAWKDPQFQAEIAKESSPYMCINCHIPLQNQQQFVVTGLKDGNIYEPIQHENKRFDAELQQEGINCASCHVRDGAVISTSVSNKAPHKSVKNTIHLSEQLCISCHNAVAVLTPELVCTFETGDEWSSSPYKKDKNCISCHMPSLHRPIAKGEQPKPGKMHYFMGSGIPKHDTLRVERLDGLVFNFNGISSSYNSLDSIELKATVTNSLAGHRVPTGDPERFVLTTLSVYSKQGKQLVKKDTFRIGEHWEWYPVARKIEDNNLALLESRTYSLSAQLDKGDYEFLLESFKFRTTEEMIKYNKLEATYPTHIKFYEKRIAFVVN